MTKITTFKYYLIYKPYNMLSQFSVESEKQTLAHLFDFPKDVYPLGRLDADSEGLLILTNDKTLNHKLLNPKQNHSRTYWAQVEGQINPEAIKLLESGMEINIDGKNYKTKTAKAKILSPAPVVPDRNPPIRFRKNIPTSWVQLTLTEGKNRQVRKMTAKAGFPTLRLIRVAIEDLKIDNMQPGDVVEMQQQELFKKLKIK